MHIQILFFRLRLQSIRTPVLPNNVQAAMHNMRNFIMRSTNNINTVRFRNARFPTARNTPTTVYIHTN